MRFSRQGYWSGLPATREAQSCFYCNLTKRAAYWRPTWTPAFCHYLKQAWEGISPQESGGMEGWEDFQDAGSEGQDASSDLPALCSGRLGFLVKMNKPSLAHRVQCGSSQTKKGSRSLTVKCEIHCVVLTVWLLWLTSQWGRPSKGVWEASPRALWSFVLAAWKQRDNGDPDIKPFPRRDTKDLEAWMDG